MKSSYLGTKTKSLSFLIQNILQQDGEFLIFKYDKNEFAGDKCSVRLQRIPHHHFEELMKKKRQDELGTSDDDEPMDESSANRTEIDQSAGGNESGGEQSDDEKTEVAENLDAEIAESERWVNDRTERLENQMEVDETQANRDHEPKAAVAECESSGDKSDRPASLNDAPRASLLPGYELDALLAADQISVYRSPNDESMDGDQE